MKLDLWTHLLSQGAAKGLARDWIVILKSAL